MTSPGMTHTDDCTDCGCDETCTAPLPPEIHEHTRACFAVGCPVIAAERRDRRPLTEWLDELEHASVLRQEVAFDSLLAALRRVAALHEPFGIYDECGHDHTQEELDDPASPVVEVDDIGLTCEVGLMYRVCEHCCTTGKHFYDFQTEECVSAHKHGKDEPMCPTMAAIVEVMS